MKQISRRNFLKTSAAGVAAALLCGCAVEPEIVGDNELTKKEIKDGWTLLWDGKTTEGWRGAKLDEFPENGWIIEDGMLKVMESGGWEFQILDDELHPDAKLGVKGNRTAASLYDLITAKKENANYDMGAWNNARVIVQGDHVEHWLNGVKVVEYERNNQMFDALVAYSKYKVWPNFGNFKSGHILLQDHGNEVWFKNVKIKELN